MARLGLPSLNGALLHARLPPGAELRRVGGLVLRVLAAIGGGYGIAALATIVLSVSLPMARSEAVLTSTMASFGIYAGAIVWAFAARRVLQVYMGMAAVAALLFLVHFIVQGRIS